MFAENFRPAPSLICFQTSEQNYFSTHDNSALEKSWKIYTAPFTNLASLYENHVKHFNDIDFQRRHIERLYKDLLKVDLNNEPYPPSQLFYQLLSYFKYIKVNYAHKIDKYEVAVFATFDGQVAFEIYDKPRTSRYASEDEHHSELSRKIFKLMISLANQFEIWYKLRDPSTDTTVDSGTQTDDIDKRNVECQTDAMVEEEESEEDLEIPSKKRALIDAVNKINSRVSQSTISSPAMDEEDGSIEQTPQLHEINSQANTLISSPAENICPAQLSSIANEHSSGSVSTQSEQSGKSFLEQSTTNKSVVPISTLSQISKQSSRPLSTDPLAINETVNPQFKASTSQSVSKRVVVTSKRRKLASQDVEASSNSEEDHNEASSVVDKPSTSLSSKSPSKQNRDTYSTRGSTSGRNDRVRAKKELLEKRINSQLNSANNTAGNYKCPHCDKIFKRSGKYRTHLLTHERSKPFSCNYPDCSGFAFHSQTEALRHIYNHPFPPSECVLKYLVIDKSLLE